MPYRLALATNIGVRLKCGVQDALKFGLFSAKDVIRFVVV